MPLNIPNSPKAFSKNTYTKGKGMGVTANILLLDPLFLR